MAIYFMTFSSSFCKCFSMKEYMLKDTLKNKIVRKSLYTVMVKVFIQFVHMHFFIFANKCEDIIQPIDLNCLVQ